MNKFESFIYKMLVNELALWRISADEIYAISLMVQNDWDHPMCPIIYFSHNPIKLKGIEQGIKQSRRQELENKFRQSNQNENDKERWNPSTWGGSNGIIIGVGCDEDGNVEASTDDESKQIIEMRQEWLKGLGLWYAIDDIEGMIKGRATFAVEAAVFQLCVGIVQRLHSQDIIRDALGKVVPVIIHTLDCGLDSLAYTRAANPTGLSKEYEAWLLQGCSVTPSLQSIERWPGEWQFKESTD